MKLASVLSSIVAFGIALGGVASAEPGRDGGDRHPLRQAILERFDRNHDGRLEPREKHQAIRALRRMARQLARSERAQGARAKRPQGAQRIIRKYDLNGDGNVGPAEMPPAMANRLRPLDRNGDGWVDDNDFAQ